ncbi:MAG: hypothetical protein ACOYOU_16695, partial [Kiritimatiellia bacterium]
PLYANDDGSGCGGSCNGSVEALLASLDIRIDLGRGDLLRTGYLQLLREEIGPGAFDPEALRFVRGPANADVVYDPDPARTNTLRQVMAGECLADIVPATPQGFTVNLYQPGDVATNLDALGLYQAVSNATPFARYIVSNPSGDTNDCAALRLVIARDGLETTNLYALTSADGTNGWTLSSGGRVETLASQTDGVCRVETRTVANAMGSAATRTRTTRRAYPFGERIVEIVQDFGGANLVTSNEWWQAGDPGFDGAPGLLRRATYPDGRWIRYYYDRYSRLTNAVSGWLDAAPDAPASSCRSIDYDYGSLNSDFDKSLVNVQRPRTVTEWIAGKFVSRHYQLNYQNAAGEIVVDSELAATAGSAFGDPANRRMVSVYYPKATYGTPMGRNLAGLVRGSLVVSDPGRLKSRTDSGGIVVSYSYARGSIRNDASPENRTFVENPLLSCQQTVVTYGTTNNPNGIPGRTLQKQYVRDSAGRLLREETWICASPASYERLAWKFYDRDTRGRVVATYRSDGANTETTWSCCGPESVTGPDGARTGYSYDARKRPVLATIEASPDRISATGYDAANRVVSSAVYAGGLSLSSTNTYDGAGRLSYFRNEGGVETFHAYGSRSDTTVRGDLTNIVTRFADGRTHYIEQNGVRKATYAYGGNDDGTRWTTVYEGPLGADSAAWVKTVTDPLGRAISEERPAFGGGSLVISNSYTGDRLIAAVKTHGSAILSRTLYTYDEIGQPLLTIEDLDLDGAISFNGPDRITGRSSRYVKNSGLWAGFWSWEKASWIYPDSGSGVPRTNAHVRTLITGLGGAYSSGGISGTLTAETVSYDSLGNATVARTVVDRDNKTVYRLTETPGSSVPALTVTVNGVLQSSRSTHDLVTLYSHDALGRITAAEDARGAVYSRGFDGFGRVAWESDPASNGTWYVYDLLGRRVEVTNALGEVTHAAYNPDGRVVGTWGATYPVVYDFDAYDRMSAMRTFRSEEGAGDETRWLYDEATGLLTNKLYADGKGTAYTYTPDGKLATRVWARGITTVYSFDPAGTLTNIAYSDATPAVRFTCNRLGQPISAIAAGVSTNLYAYSAAGLLTNETVHGQGSIVKSYDSLGRPSGFSWGGANPPGEPPYSVAYGFDGYGRFNAVTSFVGGVQAGVSYSRLANSDLIETTAFSGGLTTTRSYEPARGLVTAVENAFGSTVISRFDYANDELGRRTSRADSGSAFTVQPTYGNTATVPAPAVNLYGYNARSELTSAQRFWGSDPENPGAAVLGQQYAYSFDPIGNRISAAEGDAER